MKYKKAAFSFSLILLLLWGCLGAGSTLAWFTDEDNEIRNVFHFANFELEVSYRLEDGSWEKIDQETTIFDANALYEPGYAQVVYLRVKNKGSVPFNFKTAVTVTEPAVATNYFGKTFLLQESLKFGLVARDSEEAILAAVDTRVEAMELAVNKLCNYANQFPTLEAGGTIYMALVVAMPEDVGNEANYRGNTVPKVELGITVTATQVNASWEEQ